jgi:hypothetical protein
MSEKMAANEWAIACETANCGRDVFFFRNQADAVECNSVVAHDKSSRPTMSFFFYREASITQNGLHEMANEFRNFLIAGSALGFDWQRARPRSSRNGRWG